nr:hypothetical protein [Natronococcus amylolyticus]
MHVGLDDVVFGRVKELPKGHDADESARIICDVQVVNGSFVGDGFELAELLDRLSNERFLGNRNKIGFRDVGDAVGVEFAAVGGDPVSVLHTPHHGRASE